MLFRCPRFRDQVYMLKRNEWWTDGVSNLQWKHWNYVTYLWKARTWASPCSNHINCFPWAKNLKKKRELGYKINRPMHKIYQLMPSWETKSNSQSLCISSKSPFLRGYSEKAGSRSMAWDMSLNQLIYLICRRNWRLWLKKRIGKLEWGMHGVM